MLRRTILPFDNHSGSSALTVQKHSVGDCQYTWQSLARCSTEQARENLSFEVAQKLQVLPLGLMHFGSRRLLTAAVAEGRSSEIERSLRFAIEHEAKLIEVPAQILERAIFAAYNQNTQQLLEATQQLQLRSQNKNSVIPIVTPFRAAGGEIGEFLEKLVDYAAAQEVSDLHILPRAEGSFCKLRIKGDLFSHQDPICTLQTHQQLVTRIKVLAGIDTTVKERPHDGLLRVPIGSSEITLRVSTMPTLHGEKVVLRFCGTNGAQDLSQIKLPTGVASMISDVLEHRRGTILMTGSTGSGKTTTMYAALKELTRHSLNIVTIEDPIEILLPQATQTSINLRQGLDYPTALRCTLRQDPDVILIGEIRDRDSADVAMNAALSGHLILSTVHGRDVFEAILRLRLLGVDPLTISQALSLIVCQRLIRRLCAACKVFDLKGSNHAQQTLWRAVGCAQCDYTGFEGRQPIAEALVINPSISAQILKGNLSKQEMQALVGEHDYISFAQTAKLALQSGEVLASDLEVALD